MNDETKTHARLKQELAEARAEIATLKAANTQSRQIHGVLTPTAEEMETILDSQLEHVIYQDLDHRVLWPNRAAYESVGVTREELIGRHCYEIWPQRSERCEDCPVAVAMQTKQTQSVEKETPDGRSWFIRGYPVLDAAGNVVGGIEVTQDITERKKIEAEHARLQQETIEAQRHALQELSTPVIPIMDRIIVMPLIGSIDSLRARDITRTLLAGIQQHRAKVVILDVTGVGIMDTGIVNHLNKTIQAARLKGAQTIVTGMSDAVAEAIVDLGIDWSNIQTLADLQTGLLVALDNLGVRLNRVS